MIDKEGEILRDWVEKTNDQKVLNRIFKRAIERKDTGLLYEAWVKSLVTECNETHEDDDKA